MTLATVVLCLLPQNVSFDDKLLATIDDDVVADRFVFSADGRQVAYRGLKAGRYAVWLNNKKGPDFQGVDGLQFTKDNRLVYKGNRGGTVQVYVGGSALGPALPVISDLVVSPDGKKIAYVGSRGQGGASDATAWTVYVGGTKGKDYASCGTPVFSADGSVYGHTVRIGKAGDGQRAFHTVHAVIVNGKLGAEWEECSAPVFAPQGRRWAHRARNGTTWQMVVDGKAESGFRSLGEPIWSPDGKNLAYIGSTGPNQWHVVKNGRKGPEVPSVSSLVWSPDSTKLAYVVRGQKGATVHAGDWTSAEYFDVAEPTWSPDGSKVAFPAMGKKRWMMVVGDREGSDDLDTPGRPVFSPDGMQVAFRAMWKFKWIVVVNDGKAEPFDAVNDPVWSPKGNKVAFSASKDGKWYMVVHYRRQEAFDAVLTPPHFSEDGTKVAFGARKGPDLIWRVVPVLE